LVANIPNVLPMATNMPSADVTYTPANSITVTTAGTYEINYFTDLSAAVGLAVTVSVRQNGTAIPSATSTQTLVAGIRTPISGNTMVTLPAGAVLDMVVSAPLATTITLGSGLNASLTVKKLN